MTRARALVAALPLLALAACGSPPSADQDRSQAASDPTLAADSPVALTPVSQEGDAALIRGTLALEDGCLYLRNGTERVLPTFPWPGTRWKPATQTLTIFGRMHYRVGEPLEAGGGFITPDGGGEGRAVEQLLVMPRPQCDLSRVAVLYFGPG